MKRCFCKKAKIIKDNNYIHCRYSICSSEALQMPEDNGKKSASTETSKKSEGQNNGSFLR